MAFDLHLNESINICALIYVSLFNRDLFLSQYQYFVVYCKCYISSLSAYKIGILRTIYVFTYFFYEGKCFSCFLLKHVISQWKEVLFEIFLQRLLNTTYELNRIFFRGDLRLRENTSIFYIYSSP